MLKSMTGYASGRGEHGDASWSWELRAVNGKGLDLRLRVPDWIDGLEPALRAAVSKSVARGSVSLNLRVTRDESTGLLAVNPSALSAALTALGEVQQAAQAQGMELRDSSAADILNLRGVLEARAAETDTKALSAALLADFQAIIDAFNAMRAEEGQALAKLLSDQLDRVAELTASAADLADARREAVAQALRDNLARVLDAADGADPDRVAQELALLAVKADVTEELDRLSAHVDAARGLLEADEPVGRKLDFLMQEFNREANTLCSKAQSAPLTAVGLELKAVIDQMREQVQNVE